MKRHRPKTSGISAHCNRQAFTLVELMVSIALVIALMIGIEQLFQITSDSIQAGQTFGAMNRDAQTAQVTLNEDMRSIIKDTPIFIIGQKNVIEFLNKADSQTGTDPSFITDTVAQPGNPTVVNTPVNTTVPGSRLHRNDLLGFFAHGQFRNKTPNYGSFTSVETASDAFIQYSMLRLPQTAASNKIYIQPQYIGPAAGDPNLLFAPFASQWVLGRSVVLFRDPHTIPNTDVYLSPTLGNTGGYGTNTDLQPISPGSLDSTGILGTGPHIGRYDMAAMTLEQYRQKITNAMLAPQFSGIQYTGWWVPFFSDQTQMPQYTTVPSLTLSYPSQSSSLPPNFACFNGDPRSDVVAAADKVTAPLDAGSIAMVAPYFLQHCSQFIVEYAGDYLQQDPITGNLTGLGPDGNIDYIVDGNGNRQIRWYGMPRMTHAVMPGTLPSLRGFSTSDNVTNINNYVDVIPLRDYYYLWENANHLAPTPPSFEYCMSLPTSSVGDYFASGINPGAAYAAVWHNDTPAMIRILVKLDDPNNKVQDGPWFEFVYRLK